MVKKVKAFIVLYLFIYLSRFFLDNLFAYDSSENTWNWTFKHSKANNQHSDGILSLIDSNRLNYHNSYDYDLNEDSRKFSGISSAPSQKIRGTSFLMQYSEDCELEYCRLKSCSYSDSFSHSASNLNEEVIDTLSRNDTELDSKLVDYSCLSSKI